MSLFTKPTRRIPGSMTAYLQPAQRYMRCHRAGSAPGGISGGVNRPSADLRPAGLTASSDRKQREQMTARQPILKLVIQTYSLSLSLPPLLSPSLLALLLSPSVCPLSSPRVSFLSVGPSLDCSSSASSSRLPLDHHQRSLALTLSHPRLSLACRLPYHHHPSSVHQTAQCSITLNSIHFHHVNPCSSCFHRHSQYHHHLEGAA